MDRLAATRDAENQVSRSPHVVGVALRYCLFHGPGRGGSMMGTLAPQCDPLAGHYRPMPEEHWQACASSGQE